MTARALSADERALWARVMASARPLRANVAAALPAPAPPPSRALAAPSGSLRPRGDRLAKGERRGGGDGIASPVPGDNLDGSWDRKITRGAVIPDSSLDLHGHTLHSAHALLDHGLDRAIARGDRVLLLVTGKPPRAESERPHVRGAIRAAVTDWLAASRHAHAIAAVRGAHPRHGGAGALYLIFRRERPGAKF